MRILSLLATLVLLIRIVLAQENKTAEFAKPPLIPPEKGYFVQEIRDGLFWVTDGLYNTMFLVSSEGVIAVDPLPNLGSRYLKAIAEVTDKPVTHVIYSHEHTDHIGAAYLFPRNAVFIAQKQTAEILARRQDLRRPIPSRTFETDYTLTVGNQTLLLAYKGPNHESGNIFIYAPKQKVLMLVDVIYPGWMAYKNLGIAEDVPGYLNAHHDALTYDFDIFLGGHVDRLGTREDVERSLEFVNELKNTVSTEMTQLIFPDYLRQSSSQKHRWDRHNDYELALVNHCYSQLFPRWSSRLRGTETYLKDNCWQMLESLAVEFPTETPTKSPSK
ncbi:MAG: MBL fold metallo-hydrolase [Acidobacteria bacterium]|nr:MBL fold metallo-hydrolase [Acidobacteriota bacterium]